LIGSGRLVTAQALGGTGALNRIGADFLKRSIRDAQVLISEPSWRDTTAPLFEGAGFKVASYPYYDAPSHAPELRRHVRRAARAPARTIIALQRLLPQPTGVDMSHEQWRGGGADLQGAGPGAA